jgi:hypothetical protein
LKKFQDSSVKVLAARRQILRAEIGMAFSEKAASPTSSGNRLSSASVLYQIDITIDPEMLAARAPLASGADSD